MEHLIFNNPNIGAIDLITDPWVRLDGSQDGIKGVSASAVVNIQTITGYDGGTPGEAYTPPREITVPIYIRHSADAEQNLHDVHRLFAPKTEGTMQFQGRLGASEIDYIVESCEIPPNQQILHGIVRLKCPDPYFRAMDVVTETIAGTNSCFSLPFHFNPRPAESEYDETHYTLDRQDEHGDYQFYISTRIASVYAEIENEGETDTEITVIYKAHAMVRNPALYDVDAGAAAVLDIDMQSGDVITITTKKGSKTITLRRGDTETNIFGAARFPFTFFTLKQGTNVFKYGADLGMDNLDVTIVYSPKFGSMYTNMPGAVNIRPDYEEIDLGLDRIAKKIKRGGFDG